METLARAEVVKSNSGVGCPDPDTGLLRAAQCLTGKSGTVVPGTGNVAVSSSLHPTPSSPIFERVFIGGGYGGCNAHVHTHKWVWFKVTLRTVITSVSDQQYLCVIYFVS